ncbi:hypothetical protein M0805_004637 [Coniferiporia weirii]|nr:hypothetical protein M0805_004637 [Coniferiporia weirii]
MPAEAQGRSLVDDEVRASTAARGQLDSLVVLIANALADADALRHELNSAQKRASRTERLLASIHGAFPGSPGTTTTSTGAGVEPTKKERLNALFDALNCETLSPPVVSQLGDLTEAMAARDRQRSLAIHTELLVQGSRTDDIGLCMSAIKLLIMRP